MPEEMVLPRKFLRTCRANMRRMKIADTSGVELTGAALLTRTLILRRLLRREVLVEGEQHVGLLMPPSVGAVISNAVLAIDRRTAVNLNYTVSADVMNACIERCGIRHVLTSRKVMEKLDIEIDAELVFLDDFKDKVTMADKAIAAAQAWLMPVAMLERKLGLTEIDPDDVLTVIFTSGSTGLPKGVMLSHRNIGSNVVAFSSAVDIRREDVIAGILPLFHSFGYTVTMWSALTLDPQVVYHFTPLDARQVGKLCGRYGVTLLIATPTFLRSYTRRCKPEDFATLNAVITGAEKLPGDVADAFEKKFGVRPLEGYGTTELSPAVCVNVPADRAGRGNEIPSREGTIGRPLPGVSVKVIDLDTGEDLGVDCSGMLLVSGPNVMKGYLGQPDKTAEVIRDGWYVTGDVAEIDEDGFIRITGRLSRFSKIGGEMVPHIRVEEEIVRALDAGKDSSADGDGGVSVIVTGVPDAKKGERLVVLHTGLDVEPRDVCARLRDAGLPAIWVPAPDGFRQVEEIPVLGTGKADLKRVKELALEQFGSP